jgi:hypothetical protein
MIASLRFGTSSAPRFALFGPRSRAVAVALLLTLAGTAARAQTVPPPEVPQVPDEPLPEWRPPPPRKSALFLSVAPQVAMAQKWRQAGLWISSIGWAQLLAAGILYGWAANINDDIGHPHTDGSGNPTSGGYGVTSVFDPSLEDKRNHIEQASTGLISIGGTMAVAGFIVYTVGQAKITIWHKEHPRDPLPPLSGF